MAEPSWWGSDFGTSVVFGSRGHCAGHMARSDKFA